MLFWKDIKHSLNDKLYRNKQSPCIFRINLLIFYICQGWSNNLFYLTLYSNIVKIYYLLIYHTWININVYIYQILLYIINILDAWVLKTYNIKVHLAYSWYWITTRLPYKTFFDLFKVDKYYIYNLASIIRHFSFLI